MSVSKNYLSFLFDPNTGSLKSPTAPVIYYKKNTDSFILKYSIPGYHQPRQSFSFVTIPDTFPNSFVADIFHYFSITNSLLFRHPKRIIPNPKNSLVFKDLNIDTHNYSDDDLDTASYNLNLALKLGKSQHSLFYFDSYYQAFKILYPNSNMTRKQLQKQFNLTISQP